MMVDTTSRHQAEEAVQERARFAALIAEVGEAVSTGDTMRDTLQRCAEALVHHLDAALARIWTLDPGSNVLVLQGSAGLYTHVDGEHSRVPVGKFKIGWIAQERKPHLTNSVIGDALVHDQRWARRERLVSFAGYPLLVEDRLFGVMAVFARRPLHDVAARGMASVARALALGIERRSAEAAPQASEARFRILANSAPAIVWMADPDGSITWVSEQWYQYCGLTPEQNAQHWPELILHPDDQDRCIEAWNRALREGPDLYEIEVRNRRHDGKYRWFLTRAVPLRDRAGRITAWLGTSTDIHDRKQAEAEARRRSEQMATLAIISRAFAESLGASEAPELVTRHIVEATGDGCLIRLTAADAGTLSPLALHHPNPEAAAMMREIASAGTEQMQQRYPGQVLESGIPVLINDLPGHPLREAVAPALRPYVDRFGVVSLYILPLVARGRRIGTITMSRERPGTHYTAADLVFLQEIATRAALAIDNARLYGELERARQRMAFLADASSALASSLDTGVTLTTLARLAVESMADYCIIYLRGDAANEPRLMVAHTDPAKEPLIRRLEQIYMPRPDNPDSVVARVLESGQPALVRNIDPGRLAEIATGEEQLELYRALDPRSSVVAPLLSRGQALGVLVLVATSARRAYGPEDLELGETLAHRAAVAVENAGLYRDAQQALHVRDEFMSSASHDLRTPLTTIKGQAQLLARGLARGRPQDTERMIEGMNRIDAAASRMMMLIGQLLDLARLQTGRPLELNREPFDLVSLVRRCAEDHQRASRRHRIKVEADVPAIVGEWDPVHLERVVANLISNAIKYSPEGGTVTVSMSMSGVSDGAPQAVLRVQDEGIGIPAADLPRIFERFHRGANVVGRIAGTGIGLAGVRHIIEQHGGTITAESVVNEGATFTVRLPLTPATEE
jgi:PAS domain S-box-containing protein